MNVVSMIIRMLARGLPDSERAEIGVELCERVNGRHAPAVPHALTGGPAPDWTAVWDTLLDARMHTWRVEGLLDDEARAFFTFDDIRRAVRQLGDQLDDAYGAMCAASAVDGLVFAAGEDLDVVRERVDLHRADVVDAEITPMRPAPGPDAPRWTIDFRVHGGFVATTDRPTDGASPWRIWGTAPTAQSAAHALSWYFLDQPPIIEFERRPRRWPWARGGAAADLSGEYLSVENLLDRRGPVYDQHRDACRTARHTLRRHQGAVADFLADRAAALNTTDPQFCGADELLAPVKVALNKDHYGFADSVQWVPTRLIVATNHRTWGEFSYRQRVPSDIAAGLRGADDLDAFTYELFCDEIHLLQTPGWAGPIYRVGVNGNHRIHTARMLDLPWLAAAVHLEVTPPSWDMLGLVSSDPRTVVQRRSFDRRLHERAALITGLLRRGVIEGSLTGDGPKAVLHCRRLPATWLLRDARYATAVNAVYESRYPGALSRLGIPASAGTDANAWTAWLTSPTT